MWTKTIPRSFDDVVLFWSLTNSGAVLFYLAACLRVSQRPTWTNTMKNVVFDQRTFFSFFSLWFLFSLPPQTHNSPLSELVINFLTWLLVMDVSLLEFFSVWEKQVSQRIHWFGAEQTNYWFEKTQLSHKWSNCKKSSPITAAFHIKVNRFRVTFMSQTSSMFINNIILSPGPFLLRQHWWDDQRFPNDHF